MKSKENLKHLFLSVSKNMIELKEASVNPTNPTGLRQMLCILVPKMYSNDVMKKLINIKDFLESTSNDPTIIKEHVSFSMLFEQYVEETLNSIN